MTNELDFRENSLQLLKHLEHILECDTLIDEVDFIHPSQFVTLNEDTSYLSRQSVNTILQSADEILNTDILENVFWNRDHKLAISTQALFPLYNAATHAFFAALKQHKMLINLTGKMDQSVDGTVPTNCSVSEEFVESEVMKHSRALLLLSCDFGSAWNSRKLVVSKKQNFSLFMNELFLSALILSYAPKSEHAWSHRRWVIKMIAGKCSNLHEIVGEESGLVEKIAEKSKMNYRAWSHRCWLILYMTRRQVFDELTKSRKWAELHVADNCCFHYRRQLMLRMLKDRCSKQDLKVCSSYMPDLDRVWKEELDWDEILIKRYIGREALWLHRRFLSECWIKHFATHARGAVLNSVKHTDINHDRGFFIDNELQLINSCLTIPDNDFEDVPAQAMLAAAYVLWVSKQIPRSEEIEFRERLTEIGDLKTMLNKVCPERTALWDGLLG